MAAGFSSGSFSVVEKLSKKLAFRLVKPDDKPIFILLSISSMIVCLCALPGLCGGASVQKSGFTDNFRLASADRGQFSDGPLLADFLRRSFCTPPVSYCIPETDDGTEGRDLVY